RELGEKMHSSEWVFQPPLLRGVNVELLNRNLWQQFYENNTSEMIITKSGRCMFPSVQINVNGLEKRENYYVLMKIAPASDRRHKYCGYQNGGENSNMGGWSFVGSAEPQQPCGYRIYKHPKSPATGSHWMDNPISFNKLKLTYNINDPNNNVVLTSMHKYVSRIWIVRCFDAKNYNELFTHSTALFAFKETEFIAVTAYQNENITKLKINNNPFAKGFREMGQSRFKRKHHSIDHQTQSYSSLEGVPLTYDSESNQPNDPPPL
ncbi:T-box protein 2-like, partial [Temnothorax curvispinosus]|uniref:T-box protein 2-like n=1 Tax=Temnothorax curvispinosus TaxID=300111 RepID=A0A6J1PGX2_9HYME